MNPQNLAKPTHPFERLGKVHEHYFDKLLIVNYSSKKMVIDLGRPSAIEAYLLCVGINAGFDSRYSCFTKK